MPDPPILVATQPGVTGAATVHAAAEVHQPSRALDERGEQTGREDVDGQRPGVAVHRSGLARLAVADTRVMDDHVEAAQRVDLVGDRTRLAGAAEVTDRDVRHTRGRGPQVGRPAGVAGVTGDLMTGLDEQPRRGQAEAVARSGDEDPRNNQASGS